MFIISNPNKALVKRVCKLYIKEKEKFKVIEIKLDLNCSRLEIKLLNTMNGNTLTISHKDNLKNIPI